MGGRAGEGKGLLIRGGGEGRGEGKKGKVRGWKRMEGEGKGNGGAYL